MTPRGFTSYLDKSQYESYIKHLKNIGVKGLSINLELFNDKINMQYCKEKSLIGKDRYFTFLKIASKVFGTKNVRSGLIVGLESKEDTLKAVEEICKCGCMPMLSPYIPYNDIGDYPSAEFLIDIYKETERIIKKYNIPLAPLCEKCKHNTL
jgi:biotin synthase-related radical SAM superfamily protein